MKIDNHLLISENDDVTIEFRDTPNHSGTFNKGLPDTIVVHYTAGRSLESSVNWLCNKKAKASAHLVVGKDGTVVQLAPFNVITWHAGRSEWKNRKHLNNYSIGIEIDNAGLLERRAAGYYTWFDKRINDENVVLTKHKHSTIEQAWESYTLPQINIVEMLCLALKENYNMKELVGHEDISPGRKVDPGPAFPLKAIREKVIYGRKDEEETPQEEADLQKGLVTADLLNIRARPDISSLKIANPLSRGTKVEIVDKQGDWYKVNVDLQGWVSAKWVDTIMR